MTSRQWLVLGTMAILAGCAGGPQAVTTGATVTAAADVNPNNDGRASPIMVRIFRLSADEAFRSAGIVNLRGDEPAFVASDLTGPVISRLVRPGESLALDLRYAEATRFIGIVAEFIDPAADWRTVVPVPEPGLLSRVRRPDLHISLSGSTLAATFE